MESTLILIGIAVSILVSIGSIYIALKKTKPEISSIESNTEKTRAEIVRIYADELRNLKEQNLKEKNDNDKKMEEFEKKIFELNNKLNQQINDRKEDQVKYRDFINSLLLGITKLTGQIQIRGEVPVWLPPTKIPFEQE